jgi:hypothetical protein
VSFGINDEGFVRKNLTDIVDELNAAWQNAFGAQIDTAAESPLGQLTGTFAAPIAEGWELLEACYHSANPDSAIGFSLISLCALSGTTQNVASATRVLATVDIDGGVTLPVGTLAAVDGREDLQFTLSVAVTNPGGSPAAFTGSIWICTQTGPIACNAGTLTVKVSGVSGWNSITNPTDGARGADTETWTALRERREKELAQRGGSTLSAIVADVLQVPDVDDADAIENINDFASNGLPPHSFEVLIDDGLVPTADDDAVALAIWESKPAGIWPYGETSGLVTDAAGTRPVFFTRLGRRRIYISLTLTRTSRYPIDGDAQVVEAILQAAAAHFGRGDTVTALVLQSAPLAIAGVTDVPAFAMGFSASPVSASPLAIGAREKASFDSADIVLS